jgi:hypothetical protein
MIAPLVMDFIRQTESNWSKNDAETDFIMPRFNCGNFGNYYWGVYTDILISNLDTTENSSEKFSPASFYNDGFRGNFA